MPEDLVDNIVKILEGGGSESMKALVKGAQVRFIGLSSPHDRYNGALGVVSKVTDDDKYYVRLLDGSETRKATRKYLEETATSEVDDPLVAVQSDEGKRSDEGMAETKSKVEDVATANDGAERGGDTAKEAKAAEAPESNADCGAAQAAADSDMSKEAKAVEAAESKQPDAHEVKLGDADDGAAQAAADPEPTSTSLSVDSKLVPLHDGAKLAPLEGEVKSGVMKLAPL